MAKKRDSGNDNADRRRGSAGPDDQSQGDRAPQIQAAREKVRLAREALRQAEEDYVRTLDQESETLEQASEALEQLRDVSLGEVIDNVLDWVKRHPGAGVVTAAAAGFFLGRLFHRVW